MATSLWIFWWGSCCGVDRDRGDDGVVVLAMVTMEMVVVVDM